MKVLTTAILATLVVAGCSKAPQEQTDDNNSVNKTSMSLPTAKLEYVETRRGEVVDTYFDQQVPDPYRWLEDDRSEETAAWVKAQNEVTFGYLEQIPYRKQIEERLTQLWNYERVSAPFKEGKYTYFFKNDGLQNQSVLYRLDAEGNEQVFLDPNKFSEDGTTSLSDISFSRDGSMLAYAISEGGSDWRKVIVIDVETKQELEPALVDIKFSGIEWLGNQGFYYSSYDKPEGSELSAKTDQHKLYYHQLGQPQSQDVLVFGGSEEQKHRYVFGQVSDDDRYLVIEAAVSTSGNKLFVKDLSKADAPLVTVLDNTNSDTNLVDSVGDALLLVTNLNAPNKKVVRMTLNNPGPDNWQDVIPHTDNVLSISTGAGYLFAEYMVDALSKVYQYDYQGKLVREITLPDLGNAGGFEAKKEDQTVYYSFSNYLMPSTIYALNPNNGESTLHTKPQVAFDAEGYTSEQVFFESKDGTRVPMMLTYKKGLKLDGSNPTQLYGYGGFNISITPNFSPALAGWMELGGVLAMVNLRGGGEYGKAWHKAGTQMNKQNVFDDFIAAAEYLIDKGYTSNKRLMIRGGSNGGLLVGAVMTQRPDLMQVAIPQVGVLDMLRYHTFTAGAGWAYDYGTVEDSPEMFAYLKGYSPVHNVEAGTDYPATLVTTGDHDDRVVPAHSFKFAAELQAKQAGDRPTLIRIETKAGHGAGTPTDKIIELYADIYAFSLYNMGIESLNAQ
ncbi:prolyl oligopeptidase family serine peptidase [Aliiglaciecola sp. CAU 1673]|uniref:prolyl oligopeptidase family serine peptidase n=1 Tax=Aliiglaciecola sp. CAU 1673 TaxID=3032595 RepID=UPI0023D9CEB4|nr:prolyl oligopeptidase family serine peptidase [Aliiglaciecola sp. CAU 1673]MDF2178408.1 prolyl oligopeptidase family serine peptidase [Aliiglaciecola sp. CAU 1673]